MALKKSGVPSEFQLQFVTDQKGKKQYVMMRLEDYRELIDDYQDLALIASRKNDDYIPLDQALSQLRDA